MRPQLHGRHAKGAIDQRHLADGVESSRSRLKAAASRVGPFAAPTNRGETGTCAMTSSQASAVPGLDRRCTSIRGLNAKAGRRGKRRRGEKYSTHPAVVRLERLFTREAWERVSSPSGDSPRLLRSRVRFEVICEVDAINRLGKTVVASGDHIHRDFRPKSQMGCQEHIDAPAKRE
jgi:hypothetical protein